MRAKLLLLVTITALAIAAHADTWNKRYSVSGVPSLYMKTGDGNVRVTSTDASEITVRVTTDGYRLASDDVTIEESQSGASVRIEVRVPHGNHWCIGYCHRSIELEVSVPRKSNLDLNTSDGNIDVERVAGDLRFHTSDGKMGLHDLDGSLVATSGDGHIEADGRFDRLDLHSGDGHIDADARTGSRIASSWSLRSGDGSVSLRVPADLGADLDATTGDGSVTVDMPITVESGRMGRNRVHGRINGGGGLLEMHTGDGSIHVSRS